jgi:hypothetical protein
MELWSEKMFHKKSRYEIPCADLHAITIDAEHKQLRKGDLTHKLKDTFAENSRANFSHVEQIENVSFRND